MIQGEISCYKMSNYASTDTTTLAALSDFLKSRRARISPATVGIQKRSRRRTPGLRREEVADLAGVGLTWYTWLEQGRNIRVSSEVLTGIARALQLEPAERAHLFRLAGHAGPAEPATASVSPRIRRVVERWDPFPGHVTGRRRDILAWNRASDAINGWSRLPEDKRNLLWYIFMVPSTRELLVDWEDEAALSVAALRAEVGGDLSEPDYKELMTELVEASPDFAAIWARQDVRIRQEGLKRFRRRRPKRDEAERGRRRAKQRGGLSRRRERHEWTVRSKSVFRGLTSAAYSA